MRKLMVRGQSGAEVARLRSLLAQAMGDEAPLYSLQTPGKTLDAETEAALRAWQTGVGLVGDGVAGPCVWERLSAATAAPTDTKTDAPAHASPAATQVLLSEAQVRAAFPATKPANISRYWPYVQAALAALGVKQPPLLTLALALICAEAEGFVPSTESPSAANTLAGHGAFSAYNSGTPMGKRLGNTQPGDGALLRGRGFVQLTGRTAYAQMGEALGVDLLAHPDLAASPEVAAMVLAQCLKQAAAPLRKLLGSTAASAAEVSDDNLAAARALIPTGCADEAQAAQRLVQAWRQVLPAPAAPADVPADAQTSTSSTAPDATTRPGLTVRKDPTDLRDRSYQPPPLSLPPAWPQDAQLRELLPRYTAAGLILDQGEDGACTGFGLACVINHLRWQAAGFPEKLPAVSARMLYAFARRHDEYAGEDYDGSSCRGALKGWHLHGVCLDQDWSNAADARPAYGYAKRADRHTLGVYYRIENEAITDLQAAIHQVGAIYVSAWVHAGWNELPENTGNAVPDEHADLPLIPFSGVLERESGHAFAIVGYNAQGFVIQNSWGRSWGAGGFAVLSYADWLSNALDAWVLGLGVPGVVGGKVATSAVLAPAPAGAAQAAAQATAWWNEQRAYEHSLLLGQDGRVRRYLTEDEPGRSLLHQVTGRADAWFRQQSRSGPRRLVIYAHSGLHSEAEQIARAKVLGRQFMANGCYPLFVVWQTGLLASISQIAQAPLAPTATPNHANALGDALSERADRLVELTLGRSLARSAWSEVKDSARLIFEAGRAGELLTRALRALYDSWGEALEIHLIGHSAGALPLAYLVDALGAQRLGPAHNLLDAAVRSAHLYAPACSVAFANQHYASHPELLRRLHVHVLADEREREDKVAGFYNKSLLYLLSNALEADARTPLLGLQRAWLTDAASGGWDGSSSTRATLKLWRQAAGAAGLPERLRVQEATRVQASAAQQLRATHTSFEQDVALFNQTLGHILGAEPEHPARDLRGF